MILGFAIPLHVVPGSTNLDGARGGETPIRPLLAQGQRSCHVGEGRFLSLSPRDPENRHATPPN